MILQYSTCMRWHETCHAISHESMRFTKWPQHKRHTKWPKVDENSLRTTASTEHCKQPITANHCVWHLPSLWKPPTSRKPQWSGPNMSGHVRTCQDMSGYVIMITMITDWLQNFCRICRYVREFPVIRWVTECWHEWTPAFLLECLDRSLPWCNGSAFLAVFDSRLSTLFLGTLLSRNMQESGSSPKAKLTAWQWDTEPLQSKHIKNKSNIYFKNPAVVLQNRLHTPNIPQFHCDTLLFCSTWTSMTRTRTDRRTDGRACAKSLLQQSLCPKNALQTDCSHPRHEFQCIN